MATGLPESSKQVEDRIKVDVAREAPDSNPYIQNSWLLALVVGFGRRIFDFYRDLERSEQNTFPDTATGERAQQWGTIYGITQNPAAPSAGACVATGTPGTVFPLGTVLALNSDTFTVTAAGTITAQSISVLSITRSGTLATVTTVSDHNIASNVPVTLAGAGEADYNVTDVEIVVTGRDTFTYTVANAPATPATGTITAAFDTGLIPVQSDGFGLLSNQTIDTPLTLQSPISGADDVLNVDFFGLTGGANQETIDELKIRYLSEIQDPVAHFSASDISNKAKEVSGVTRVFVQESGTQVGVIAITTLTRVGQVATGVTATPHGFENGFVITIAGATEPEYNVVDAYILVVDATTFIYTVVGTPTTPATGGPVATSNIPLGVVQVYFMRDNDPTAIPSGGQITSVKNAVDTIRPANTSSANLIVSAPVGVSVAFTFTGLVPNTPTMQTAINANLAQFFEEATEVGTDIDDDAYRAVIKNTVDTQTGDTVASFTLSTPVADITIESDEIGTLGTVTI